MKLMARFLVVLSFIFFSILLLFLYLSNNARKLKQDVEKDVEKDVKKDVWRRPKFVQALEDVPGPDKILGTIRTHILRPQLRQRVHVPNVDPAILISVKTTQLYHQHRLSLLLFTWMQTLPPHQLYIVTDSEASDVWIREAHASGIHIIRSECPSGHTSESLCCKSGMEYEQFYKAMESSATKFRWFCHFDDDEYLNVVNLSKKLQSYNFSSDHYIGHWLTKHGPKPKHGGKFKNFPEAKRRSYFYATGASYCVSMSLMKKVEKYFRGKLFSETCERMGLTDDYTIGAVIGGVLGVNLTEVTTMLSQGEDFTHLDSTQLRNMITISSKLHASNRIIVPGSPFKRSEDPTGFLSYHCLLYPQVNWCRNTTILHIT